jgi:antitoxin component of MazEF toxin-antitoxin module
VIGIDHKFGRNLKKKYYVDICTYRKIYVVYLNLGGISMHTKAQLHIGRWGNSLALRIPKHISEELDISVKDSLLCTVKNGKLILEPVRISPKYTLEALLAQVVEPGEEVSWGKPEGDEIW